MKIEEINELKAYTQNEFSDDTIFLTIKINEKLRELLKGACVENLNTTEESLFVGDSDSEREYFDFERFLAKRIFYRELEGDNSKNILYCKELLNDGIIKIPFYSIYTQNRFLTAFQNDLKRLIELLIGENVEREISFNLTDTQTA